MSKYFFILLLVVLPLGYTYSCDICSCGIGNNYIGILPDFQKRILGIRYRHSGLISHISADGYLSYLSEREKYHVLEAWAGWDITPRVRVMFHLPFNINEGTSSSNVRSKSGIGDISVFGYYQVVKRTQTILDNKLLIHSLWMGGGIKFATGEYNPSEQTLVNGGTNFFQLGTGSYDFILAGMYDVRLQDFGINFSANYKINTANSDDYRYGNKWSAIIQPYYKIRIKQRLTISPSLGVNMELANRDLNREYPVTLSGGSLSLGTIGVECAVGKLAFGANFQTPLSQQLANGSVKAEDEFMLHLALIL